MTESELPRKVFEISVRSLAESIHRSGSLTSISFNGISGTEGTRLHTRVFADLKKQVSDSEIVTEYSMNTVWDMDEITLSVRGRADCILIHQNSPSDKEITILEIKSCMGDYSDISEVLMPVHWAQVMLYAYMYLDMNREVEGVYAALRYVSIETLRHVEKRSWISRLEAMEFFQKTCVSYISIARTLLEYEKERDESICRLKFPYPNVRAGQRSFMKDVLSTISQRSVLFASAPTGIGKTISTLFPAIKSLPQHKFDKIFYLTAKTATRSVAGKAINDLRSAGLILRTITLQSKESMCPCQEIYCEPLMCKYADGYYDRLSDGISSLLTNHEITPERVIRVAEKHMLCPHELSLDVSILCDVIIGDYNHAFNPRVKLERYFSTPDLHHVLLVDEAHNLVDRSRDMFSASLTMTSLNDCQRAVSGMDARVDASLADIASYMRILSDNIIHGEDGFSHVENEVLSKDVMVSGTFRGARVVPKVLYKILWKFCYFVRTILDDIPVGSLRKSILTFFFDARFFLSVLELYYDDAYVLTAECTPGNIAKGIADELSVTLFCLDASTKIRTFIMDNHAAVFFSATLSPAFYYQNMIMGDKRFADTNELSLPSPFPPENLSVYIFENIKTTYQNRLFSVNQVIDVIFDAIAKKTGNYLVYLPSFAYLKMIAAAAEDKITRDGLMKTEILVQTPSMNKSEKEIYLSRFNQFGLTSLLAFAVLGGHFGEGIDLVGDKLSGVIIVGVGLPMLCPQREIMRQYFEEKFGEGFGFAYRYPGWEKVLQAAGRVIRDEDDTGFVMLLDERYKKPEYRMLFPQHWDPISIDP